MSTYHATVERHFDAQQSQLSTTCLSLTGRGAEDRWVEGIRLVEELHEGPAGRGLLWDQRAPNGQRSRIDRAPAGAPRSLQATSVTPTTPTADRGTLPPRHLSLTLGLPGHLFEKEKPH